MACSLLSQGFTQVARLGYLSGLDVPDRHHVSPDILVCHDPVGLPQLAMVSKVLWKGGGGQMGGQGMGR